MKSRQLYFGSKLKYLDKWNEERIKMASLYKEKLKDSDIRSPIEKEGVKHVYHLFVIRTKRRDHLQRFLRDNGIFTNIHYPIPIHLQKTFKEFNKKGDFPVTEKCSIEVLSLPIFNGIKEPEIEEVSVHIKNFFIKNFDMKKEIFLKILGLKNPHDKIIDILSRFKQKGRI